jgi:predicted component of type VI protein secretion system
MKMNKHICNILMCFTLFALVGACSDEPVAGNPPNTNPPDMEMGMDMDGDSGVVTDPDMNPDMAPSSPSQRLILQPVSGSGTVKSATFKAHIQIGRVIDATSK